MDVASRKWLVSGCSKYGTVGLYKAATLESVDLVVTDNGFAADAAIAIRQAGTELALASAR
ncbi:DeoR/GlpR family transcriptional regulator of sugar metabolism [Paraburkholderia sp. WC7.3d]